MEYPCICCLFISCDIVVYPSSSEPSVSIITATTPNRLPFIPYLVERWKGYEIDEDFTIGIIVLP